jgi:hypothetical protein
MADTTQTAPTTCPYECLCGRTAKSSTMYVKNDFILCSFKCMQKFFSDVPTIPSNVVIDKSTHAVCRCGIIYPQSLKFTVYGKQCCSPECIKVIRDEIEDSTKSKKPEMFISKPDAGGSFAF